MPVYPCRYVGCHDAGSELWQGVAVRQRGGKARPAAAQLCPHHKALVERAVAQGYPVRIRWRMVPQVAIMTPT